MCVFLPFTFVVQRRTIAWGLRWYQIIKVGQLKMGDFPNNGSVIHWSENIISVAHIDHISAQVLIFDTKQYTYCL